MIKMLSFQGFRSSGLIAVRLALAVAGLSTPALAQTNALDQAFGPNATALNTLPVSGLELGHATTAIKVFDELTIYTPPALQVNIAENPQTRVFMSDVINPLITEPRLTRENVSLLIDQLLQDDTTNQFSGYTGVELEQYAVSGARLLESLKQQQPELVERVDLFKERVGLTPGGDEDMMFDLYLSDVSKRDNMIKLLTSTDQFSEFLRNDLYAAALLAKMEYGPDTDSEEPRESPAPQEPQDTGFVQAATPPDPGIQQMLFQPLPVSQDPFILAMNSLMNKYPNPQELTPQQLTDILRNYSHFNWNKVSGGSGS